MSKKSQLVSGMGLATQMVAEIVRLAQDMGVSEERLHVLGTSEGVPYLRTLVTALAEKPTEERFRVLATPSGEIHLEKMIRSLSSCEDTSGAVYPTYPGWVVKHLTPGLEAKSSSGVRNPGLGFHERQEKRQFVTGDEIFAFLLPDQKTYQAQWSDPIHRCVSLADIQYYEKYSHLIPLEWRRKLVYAWKSVALSEDGSRVAPYLNCDGGRPYVSWYNLVNFWDDDEPAGLSAS